MALAFRTLTLNFESKNGSEHVETETAVFSGQVKMAHAVLNGFDVQYDKEDRELKRLKVDLSKKPAINGNTVTVTGRYLLRDASGNVDDPYSGQVDVLVIADVA